MNRFVFVIPAYNAANTVQRTILSVWFQTYPNWHLIIMDDMSTDNTIDVINATIDMLDIRNKVTFIANTDKKWEVGNIIQGLSHCDPSDIVCRLDADDWLCDCDALSIIDAKYRNLNCDVLWTSHRWSFTNTNISAALPNDANPYTHPWVSSHLKTFRKSLVESVSDNNFRDKSGEYFKRIGDQALYLPVLYKSAGNWHYEPIVAYHYTINMQPETFQTDDSKFQRDEALFLRSRGFVE